MPSAWKDYFINHNICAPLLSINLVLHCAIVIPISVKDGLVVHFVNSRVAQAQSDFFRFTNIIDLYPL